MSPAKPPSRISPKKQNNEAVRVHITYGPAEKAPRECTMQICRKCRCVMCAEEVCVCRMLICRISSE